LEDKVFSFGMQVGLMNYQTDPSQLNLNNPDDPSFGMINETKFNLGAGAMLKGDKYLIGFSVPHMLSSSLETAEGAIKIYQQHFYLMGSYVHFLNDRILLKPSMLVKGVSGAPVSVDVNFNINIDRNYTLGAFTRNLKSYGLLAQMNFLEKYKLGYVFEVPSNSSVGTRFTTHEVMISIRTAVFDFHERSISNF
jgi:type IX secretion system PorP/SprF family membrane protein